MKATWILICFCFLLSEASAQSAFELDTNQVRQQSAQAAQEALKTLKGLAAEDAQALGFEAAEEASKAELDAPIQDYMVKLDALREFQAGQSPVALLSPTGLLVYPVKVAGEVKSSIELRKDGADWKAASFGAHLSVKSLHAARQRVMTLKRSADKDPIRVGIPALNLTFIGYYEDGKLMLNPTNDEDAYGVRANTAVPAAELFERLRPFAQQHNGLPG
jgi:hypothetical protein